MRWTRPMLVPTLLAATMCGCGGGGGGGNVETSPSPSVANPERAVSISEQREAALSELIQLSTNEYPQVRANSLEGLTPAPGRLAQPVRPALRDPNEGVRSIAAYSVGKAGLRNLAGDVRSMQTDSSPFVRASSVYALTVLGEPVDPTPLARLLLESPSSRVRAHTAFLLGEMGQPSAIGLLRQAAQINLPRASDSEIKLLQLQIAEAMIKLGDESQLPVVRAALYPARPEELEATALAVQILGEVQDRKAISQLIALSSDERNPTQIMPAEVRLAAATALAKMGRRDGVFIADEYREDPSPVLRAQAAAAYGQILGRSELGKLQSLMLDESPFVRVSAAAAMVEATDRLQSR